MNAARSPQHSRFLAIRKRLEVYTPPAGWPSWFYEFLLFGFKQAWACLFGGLLLVLLLGTHFLYPDNAALHRYDFLTIAAIAIQLGMLALKLETPREALVILIFHVVGTRMELFKTAAGSWVYPEASLLHIGEVPLFSGFMYAAVGSYIARIWRIFEFRFTHYPPRWATWLLAAAVYANFFAHHWTVDIRLALFAGAILLFVRSWIGYRPWREYRRMPLLLGQLLVALFIWFAENLATFANAWNYPDQAAGWQMVSISKLGSWFLLMLISFVLVELVQKARAPSSSSSRPPRRDPDSTSMEQK